MEASAFASPRDLPALERLKVEGLLQRGQGSPSSTIRSDSLTGKRLLEKHLEPLVSWPMKKIVPTPPLANSGSGASSDWGEKG